MNSPERRPFLAALEPLRHPVFRRLWSASLASNTGSWMHDVAEAWLMTSLTASPLMVAMIQAGESLPVFLLALPAGALADVVDRRRILIASQVWLAACAAALGLLTLGGHATPSILILFAFLMGVGAAISAPAWQSAIPEVVGREQLPAAITLNGIGFNLSRLIGPAIGGALVASAGAGSVFLINGASFLIVLAAVFLWRAQRPPRTSPPERAAGAMIAGLRYARHYSPLHAVFWRAGVFIAFGSALWSLLPVLARRELGAGSAGYGLLIGSLGAGATGMALLLPRVRERVRADQLILSAELLFAACLALLALSRTLPQACAAMFVGGTAWIALLSTFNTAAQSVVPAWVRGRALSLYQVVFQAGTIAGSLGWGAVAERAGVRAAFFLCAAGLAAAAVATIRFRLNAGEKLDTTQLAFWDQPVVALDLQPEQGPVLVLIDYRVAEKDQETFAARIKQRSITRRRDGATDWGLYRDASDPARIVEIFTVESWAEHLRQHERTTAADKDEEMGVRLLHAGKSPPVVSHLIAISTNKIHSDAMRPVHG